MNWHQRLESRLNSKASQITQFVWLAFAVLALSLAIPGIPRYIDLLHTPCDGTDCFGAQLTLEMAQAQIVTWGTLGSYALVQSFVLLMMAGLLLSTAGFLIWRKPHQRVSVLAAFVGTALATGTLSQALAHTDQRFWLLAQFIVFVQMAGLLPLFCLFPDGRFQPRPMRWVALAYVLASVIYLMPRHQEWLAPGTLGGALWLIFGLASLLVVFATLFYRFRRAAAFVQQEQMLWVLAGLGLAALVVLWGTPLSLVNFSFTPFETMLPNPSGVTVLTGLLLAVGSFTCLLVALFNYEPLDTQLLINRTLVYGALTTFVVGAYTLVVGAVGALLRVEGNIVLSLIATGLVAIAFNPLRERLQRGVNRLMYGDRDDPYRALSRLGQRLEAAGESSAILATTVEAVAQTLKLPYVAIALKQGGGSGSGLQLMVVHGTEAAPMTRFPLNYAGEMVGELIVAARVSESLNTADQRLLADLARPIGVAAHAFRLTADLERARLRIVAEREEARRRLGSDLHDGVGHQLAGLARKAELATNLLERDPTAARVMLAEVTQQLNIAITQVRGLAHQLHPPELELLGLVDALRERAQVQSNFAIRVDAPDSLPPLPTAIETAAYYIALEALTNVEKHAGAKLCHIHLTLVDSDPPVLEMDIADDGRGLSPQTAGGLGLLSMQARAAEVGGLCRIESTSQGGARVSVRLPCPAQLE
jgi:signal transduction histidine kinase